MSSVREGAEVARPWLLCERQERERERERGRQFCDIDATIILSLLDLVGLKAFSSICYPGLGRRIYYDGRVDEGGCRASTTSLSPLLECQS